MPNRVEPSTVLPKVELMAAPNLQRVLEAKNFSKGVDKLRRAGRLEEALRLVETWVASGSAVDEYILGQHMHLLMLLGRREEALRLFTQLRKEGLAGSLAYGLALEEAAKGGRAEEALELMEEMRQRGKRRQVVNYTQLMDALRRAGRPRDGLKVFESMSALEPDLRPSVAQVNLALELHAQLGADEDALRLFADTFESRGAALRPDSLSYTALLTALGAARGVLAAKRALRYFEKMRKQGVTPLARTYSALLRALGRAGYARPEHGLADRAEELFAEAVSCGLADIRVCTAAIQAFGWHGRLEAARRVYTLIPPEQRDLRLRIVYMDALAHAGLVEEVASLAQEIQPPNPFAYAALLRACSRAQPPDYEAALRHFVAFRDAHPHLNVPRPLWRHLLATLQRANRLDLLQQHNLVPPPSALTQPAAAEGSVPPPTSSIQPTDSEASVQ
jgi:pentatricopeptide repeat protein